MRRLFIICLLALSATALVVSVPAAPAAKKKASTPSITRVMPMRISVGARLTILGKNFKTERKANTVIFRAPNGRSAFAKPRRASRTKLVVVVPSAVARLLGGSVNNPKPTRLKLRVLAGKFSAFTTRRLSPVVTSFGSGDGPGGGSPGGGSGGGGSTGGGSTGGGSTGGGPAAAACASSADHDGDMLPNALEADLTTDPCLADTDGDGVGDGYEYKSAVDLNNDDYQEPNQSLPYPGKRPYPNPLDPSDVGTDFDGDSLALGAEQSLWLISSAPAGRVLDNPLSYSDGLTNFDENGGRARAGWWSSCYPAETPYYVTYADTDLADPDSDGDGVRDGADDQDHDDLPNLMEMSRLDAATPVRGLDGACGDDDGLPI